MGLNELDKARRRYTQASPSVGRAGIAGVNGRRRTEWTPRPSFAGKAGVSILDMSG